MNVYEKAIKTVEDYLYRLGELDTTYHIREGEYRLVFNNWDGWCESTITIGIDYETKCLTYKMYYNAKSTTEEQKETLKEYFARIDKKTIREKCTGGVEDNGAVFVKVEHSCILYGLTCDQLQEMQKICTDRIFDDRAAIKRFLRG